MSFADEIARTEKLVFWETVEFNPDLWEGYRDERVQWSINECELGSYHRRPRHPTNNPKSFQEALTIRTQCKTSCDPLELVRTDAHFAFLVSSSGKQSEHQFLQALEGHSLFCIVFLL